MFRRICLALCCAIWVGFGTGSGGLSSSLAAEQIHNSPRLFDPKAHEDVPDLGEIKSIRFLTENDYPPLQFLRSDGELAGFNIDLARAICEELKVACTVQPWRWDKLNDALASGAGDAIIASQKPTKDTSSTQIFSAPYYLTPARFMTLKDSPILEASPETLKGKNIGVVTGTAHEAYLRAMFVDTIAKPYPNLAAAEAALQAKEVDGIFADGPTLSIWLAKDKAAACCEFRGGPLLDSTYFGEGARIAFRHDDQLLRVAVNTALRRLDASGRLAELYWKYFPVGFY